MSDMAISIQRVATTIVVGAVLSALVNLGLDPASVSTAEAFVVPMVTGAVSLVYFVGARLITRRYPQLPLLGRRVDPVYLDRKLPAVTGGKPNES